MSREKNFAIEMMIAGDRNLSDFLQSRPQDEELGESLDLYERHLKTEGLLTHEEKTNIRSCHLQYLSDLLDSDLPIKTLGEANIGEDNIIQEFCDDQEYLYSHKLSENDLRAFADAYQSVHSPFVNYMMAKILLRHHIMDKAFEYYDKALETVLFSIGDFWNNKESFYAGSELLFDIISSEHFNSSACNGVLLGKILEYAYLLLSRVILWPENDDGRLDGYDVPITYRHIISSLNKRAEILLKHKGYFENLVPSYSTAEVLAIADYSSAHSFALAWKKVGTKSLFKLDAKRLYSVLSKDGIRPYSTAILDGKKDSVEMAHRFYLKYKKNHYLLSKQEYTEICQLLKDIIEEQHVPINKIDEKQIRQYLSDNGIEYFYHFTERENIENIKRNGGILSLKHCLLNAVEVNTKGDMTILRDTDASYQLEDYARLSFCKIHPLIRKRQKAGADLVLLKIKPDVAWRYDTLFSDRDAALPDHQRGSTIDDLKKVRMDAIRKTDLEEGTPDYAYNQAEVMVKSSVPIDYIVNIDAPIEIPPQESTVPSDVEINKGNLERAISTIATLSSLFRNSSFLLSSNDGRNEKKRMTMYSLAGILGYLYEKEYYFGDYSLLVDMAMQRHYAMIKATMYDPENRNYAVSALANNWSDILQIILEIRNSNSPESGSFTELKTEIDHVTNIVEAVSGSKCRRPIIGFAKIQDSQRTQFNQDTFTHMVEEAEYNPFRITNDPSLQNFPPIPDGLGDTFRTELLRLYKNSGMQGRGETELFFSYVFSLIKSYYDNAGYVPKNTVDAIIEQCDQSIKGTLFRWHLPSLDEMKYRIYQILFSYQQENMVLQEELRQAIIDLNSCLTDVVSCQTMVMFHAPMGSYNSTLSVMLKAGNILTEYYENVYGYGKVSDFGIKGFHSGEYSVPSLRSEAVSMVKDKFPDISMMLVNLKMTGFPQDSAMANGYIHKIAQIEELFSKLT